MRSSLDKYLAPSPLSKEEVQTVARDIWKKYGIAILPLDAIEDDWIKCALLSEATRIYGPRLKNKPESIH